MPQRPVDSQESVFFSEGGEDAVDLSLELTGEPTGQNPVGGWRGVREFTVLVGVTRAASVGTIIDTGIQRQLTRNEFVEFNGSDTASLRYPISTNFTHSVEVVFAISTSGANISPGQISFAFTNRRTQIRASRPFYGAVRVRYYATYRLLAYQPEFGSEQAVGSLASFWDDGYFRRFGTVLSFYNENVATLEITPTDFTEFQLRRELYQVHSTVQVNENGAWELHPDFDSGGSWSDAGAPVDGDTILEYDRPHEIGYLVRGTTGRWDYETKTIFTEQGPPSPDSFSPVLRARIHPQSHFAGTAWESAYSGVSEASVQADILSRWPGVTFE